MKNLPALLLSVCVSTLVYAQDPASKESIAASQTSPAFELPKTTEPIYIVNDSTIITADQFKAINPLHIQSIEVRHYTNTIVEAHSEAARRGVVAIYLKDRQSFSEEF